jgi:hypothetical protein
LSASRISLLDVVAFDEDFFKTIGSDTFWLHFLAVRTHAARLQQFGAGKTRVHLQCVSARFFNHPLEQVTKLSHGVGGEAPRTLDLRKPSELCVRSWSHVLTVTWQKRR